MRILMIMNGKGIGGAELQFAELANQLALKHDVSMVCMQGGGAVSGGRLTDGIGIKVYAYSNALKGMLKIFNAIRHCRRQPADAIVTTSDIGNLVGMFAGICTGRRLVSLQTVSAEKWGKRIDGTILRRFDLLVAGCKDIKDFLLNQGQRPERIEVVNNWVDFSARRTSESRQETRARLGLRKSDRVIGCIGRMHYQKGQEYLIRAFRQISSDHPDTRLVLVGDGPTMEQMKIEADGHAHILFTGTITGDEYTNLLAAFDVYAQPSRYEGLPRTLLDAMYIGLPIVATAVNGNLDALRDGENGLLVVAEKPESLAAGLSRLLTDRDLADTLAKQAASDARSGFSMEKQTGRIEKLVASL